MPKTPNNLMRALRSQRRAFRTTISEKPDIVFEFASSGDRNQLLMVLEAYISSLKGQRDEFDALHQQTAELSDQSEAGKELEEKFETDEDLLIDGGKLITVIASAIRRIEREREEEKEREERERQERDRPASRQSSTEDKRSRVRLPKLQLPSFDGSITKWKEFWDSFRSTVDEDDTLSDIQKLNYLLPQLKGKAKEAVEGMPLSDENYQKIVNILTKRFGDESRIIDAHFADLSAIPVATNQKESLRSTVDALERHLNALEGLGENVNNRSVTTLIKSKIPTGVIVRLDEQRAKADWDTGKWREHLIDFIEVREAAEECHIHSGGGTATKPKGGDGGYQGKPHRPHFQQSSRTDNKPTTTSALVSKEATKQCAFCEKTNHWHTECKTYPTAEARRKRIEGKRCMNCLFPNHEIGQCWRKKPCFFCKRFKDHHSSLCPKQFGSASRPENVHVATEFVPPSDVSQVSQPKRENSLLASGESVLLQTATVPILNVSGSNSFKTRVLLDPGSQRSYITEGLMRRLNLRSRGTEVLEVFTFGSGPPKRVETQVVDVKIRLNDGSTFEFPANTIPMITGNLHRAAVDLRKFEHIYKDLQLADTIPNESEDFTVELLIGNDYYNDLRHSRDQIELSKGLYLINSKIGWILTGRYESSVSSHSKNAVMAVSTLLCPTQTFSFLEADPPLARKFDLTKLWDLDTIGIKDRVDDVSDERALKNFNETVQYEDNRYLVGFPWNGRESNLPSNYHLALGRLQSLLRSHKDDPEFFAKYHGIIGGQIDKGVVEVVDESTKPVREHYIPHHAVITPDKATTKMRIVYDGSAKSKKENPSVNECLHRGPVLLENLCGILIRFRLQPIAIVADIEKAFLQVSLRLEDRDVTRFLWLKDPKRLEIKDNLIVLRFTRVPFGIISSPFLLAAAIIYHLNMDGSSIAKQVLRDLYVDNIATTVSGHQAAIELYTKTKDMFNAASMNVREWASNSSDFMDSIPEVDRASGETFHVLGLPWDPGTDTFHIEGPSSFTSNLVTKRSVLQFLASIFDPLGLFSPTVLLGKMFLQKLWIQNFDWDQALPEQISSEWYQILSQITPIGSASFQRFIGRSDILPLSHELHCFCDASKDGYGTCIFLRMIFPDTILVNLVFSKARVAPVKSISLPRLELLACHIGSKCLDFVEHQLPFPVSKKVLWTDSQCVLHWLNSKKPLTVFVRNRVDFIKTFSNVTFRYVPTQDNPADLASRGASVGFLMASDLWWHGPSWLTEAGETSWPSNDFLSPSADTDDQSILYSTSVLSPEGASANNEKDDHAIAPPFEIDYENVSSFKRLLLRTAYVLRFIDLRVKRKMVDFAAEIEHARVLWLRFIQRKSFPEVFDAVDRNLKNPTKDLFGLWIDENGLLRCRGRLENSELPESAKYPILLPKKGHFTKLLIEYYHHKLFHSGVAHTLAQIRNDYWIPSGRSIVFQTLRSCTNCRRYDGGSYRLPIMPPLPKSRVTPQSPFTSTGLDYLGPLYVKLKDGSVQKVWICLFTCLSTRGIHLELIEDMTSEQFLLCLKRFIARRGKPSLIISDNAPQFKLVSSVVESIWRNVIVDPAIVSYIGSESIYWHFIPEYSPWMGGIYERLVRNVKQALRKSVGRVTLSIIQLQTIIAEIEAVINSRPLTYVGSDSESGMMITPSHFLTLNPKIGFPHCDPGDLKDADYLPSISSKDRLISIWKKGQRHLEQFWKIWSEDYLLSLRERSQSKVKQHRIRSSAPPKSGDVVLIRNEGPRGSWKIGRISSLTESADGEIRSAEVLLPSGLMTRRSLMHLYPLEVSDDDPLDNDRLIEQSAPVEPKLRPRSSRSAAAKAREKIQCIAEYEMSDE